MIKDFTSLAHVHVGWSRSDAIDGYAGQMGGEGASWREGEGQWVGGGWLEV